MRFGDVHDEKCINSVSSFRLSVFSSLLWIELADFIVDIETVEFQSCQCISLPQVLVRNGLFPTSPLHPRLAVSIDLLDFYFAIFERSADAVTALAGALKTMYSRRGFSTLNSKVWAAFATNLALGRSSLVGRGDGSGVLISDDTGVTCDGMVWSGSASVVSVPIPSSSIVRSSTLAAGPIAGGLLRISASFCCRVCRLDFFSGHRDDVAGCGPLQFAHFATSCSHCPDLLPQPSTEHSCLLPS